jgi:hypothetical protein
MRQCTEVGAAVLGFNDGSRMRPGKKVAAVVAVVEAALLRARSRNLSTLLNALLLFLAVSL